MKLSTVLSPMSDRNLTLAAQCGVEGVVARYPGDDPAELARVQQRIESFGMRLVGLEGFLPIEKIKVGADTDGAELEALKRLLDQMGDCGTPMLCYNFMAGSDWVRTRLDAPERGGAKVTAFDLADAQQAVSLDDGSPLGSEPSVDAERLWENLKRLLDAILPVAERNGVQLAMHPDDPPLPELNGKARIMHHVEGFERLIELAPSPSNAICFCVGAFRTMGVDIVNALERLGPHIAYVHFRDVRGGPESFVETFHDNGPMDMPLVIRTLRRLNFQGPIRPDHVPELEGEWDCEPGYTMLGRLFAYGYIRGLLQATTNC